MHDDLRLLVGLARADRQRNTTAGAGVEAAKLSTITLPGGAHQVTYNGHPLYTYTGDAMPGETGYVGADEFGGHWYAQNAKAKPVK